MESFEAPLQVTGLRDSRRPFTGIFIRAPVCLHRLLNVFEIDFVIDFLGRTDAIALTG